MKWVQNRMERGGLANTTTHATTHVPDARTFEVMVGEKKIVRHICMLWPRFF